MLELLQFLDEFSDEDDAEEKYFLFDINSFGTR